MFITYDLQNKAQYILPSEFPQAILISPLKLLLLLLPQFTSLVTKLQLQLFSDPNPYEKRKPDIHQVSHSIENLNQEILQFSSFSIHCCSGYLQRKLKRFYL